MTDTIIELCEEAFTAQYKMRTNHLNPTAGWACGEGGGCLFETYGEELAFVRQQHPRTVWTLCDGDDGSQYVLSGFHLVNRLGYLVSIVPVPECTIIRVHLPLPSGDTKPATAHTPEPWHVPPGTPVAIFAPDARTLRVGIAIMEPLAPPDIQLANARRICAAVNACKGISTEALERGVIAEMRHVLGELLAAAGDLDAVIDGVIDQFDAERNRLNAVLRAAQAVLDGGMALDLRELLANRNQIALIWSIEDMQEIRPDLSDEQAWEVLDLVERKHDAMLGVSWNTLEIMAEDLFGDVPETANEEE